MRGDDQPEEGHGRVGLRLPDPAGRRAGLNRQDRARRLLRGEGRGSRCLDGLGTGRPGRHRRWRPGHRGADEGAVRQRPPPPRRPDRKGRPRSRPQRARCREGVPARPSLRRAGERLTGVPAGTQAALRGGEPRGRTPSQCQARPGPARPDPRRGGVRVLRQGVRPASREPTRTPPRGRDLVASGGGDDRRCRPHRVTDEVVLDPVGTRAARHQPTARGAAPPGCRQGRRVPRDAGVQPGRRAWHPQRRDAWPGRGRLHPP